MDATARSSSSGSGPDPHGVRGRGRLLGRNVKFGLRSARTQDWDFVLNAVRACAVTGGLAARDAVVRNHRFRCNLCGWSGTGFYPNTGPGYDERNSICPGCLSSDRYRSLLEVLRHRTTAFSAGSRVVEVAPLPSLSAVFLSAPGVLYTSFDLERYAMERGDLTDMRFETGSVDWFICFHVLEHVPEEALALEEMRRVLKPGGAAVIQVPIDWEADATREYPGPDLRDVGHVRRHGRDFPERVGRFGFNVESVDPFEVAGRQAASVAGLSDEPIFIASAV